MTGHFDVPDQEILRMVELARFNAQSNNPIAAHIYYQAIIGACALLKSPIQRIACGEACAFRADKYRKDGMLGTAIDWAWRACYADPLAEDIQALYLELAGAAQAEIHKQVSKIQAAAAKAKEGVQ